MRVLHVNYSDLGGGAEEFALDLATQQAEALVLVRNKHTESEKVIPLPRNNIDKLCSVLDKFLWKLGIRISFRSFFGIQNVAHGSYRILKNMPEYADAYVVHLHNIHGEFFDLSAVRKIAMEKPVVWTSHDMWICTGGEGGIPMGPADFNPRKLYPLKGGLIDERKRQLKKKLKLLASSCNLTIIAPSDTHLETIRQVHPSVRAERIYLGVNTTIFKPAATRTEEPAKPISILIFNTTSVYKNTQFLISALEKLRAGFELHVIGKKLINPRLKNIINHGYISDRHQLARLFQRLDIGLFASRAETFGLLPAEFAACGGLVLLHACLPVFQAHHRLYKAILFDTEDQLQQLLEYYLNSPSEIKEAGAESARLIKEKFSRTDTFQHYQKLYTSLIS